MKYTIQCVHPETGATGCWLFKGDNHRLAGTSESPVFPDLADLFRWMSDNGWILAIGSHHCIKEANLPTKQGIMSNTQHTPGPWDFRNADHRWICAPVKLDGIGTWKRIAKADCPLATTEEEAFANARLIAAAPDLLQSLRLCVARLEEYQDAEGGIALDCARRSIAKAEGKA